MCARRWIIGLGTLVGLMALCSFMGAQMLPSAQAQSGSECLVSLSSTEQTVAVGETMHLWVWGTGVQQNSWDMKVDGVGELALQGARVLDAQAGFVEWSVVGAKPGDVAVSISMLCESPGDATDSLTLTVLSVAAEAANDAPIAAAPGSCLTHLSVSHSEVALGDEFYVWFVGSATEPRSWQLTTDGDGTANVLGSRELDPQYVEWRLQAANVGTLELTGVMNCLQPGQGTASGTVAIVPNRTTESPQSGGIPALGTTAWVEIALIAVLVSVLAVLAYVILRRKPRT